MEIKEGEMFKSKDGTKVEVLAVHEAGILYRECEKYRFVNGCSKDIFPKIYKPLLLITQDERVILRNIKGYTWLARDEDGRIFMYSAKPAKGTSHWLESTHHLSNFNYSHLFDFIQWTDDEPYNIDDLLWNKAKSRF
jgi:hypothetical protein